MSVSGLDASFGIKNSREINFSGFEVGINERQFCSVVCLDVSAKKVLLSKPDRGKLTMIWGSLLSIIKVVKRIPGSMPEDVTHVDLLGCSKTDKEKESQNDFHQLKVMVIKLVRDLIFKSWKMHILN
jgi:hypothetical protein